MCMMLEGPSNRNMIDQSTVTVIVLTIPNQCQHAFTYTFTVELGLEDIGGVAWWDKKGNHRHTLGQSDTNKTTKE